MQKIPEAEAQNLDFFNSAKSNKHEKEILLEAYDREQRKVKNITFKNLFFVYIAIAVFLLLLLPKIYISNQIYYASKEINSKYHKYTALKEENAHLKRQFELLRYKIEVIDEIEFDNDAQ